MAIFEKKNQENSVNSTILFLVKELERYAEQKVKNDEFLDFLVIHAYQPNQNHVEFDSDADNWHKPCLWHSINQLHEDNAMLKKQIKDHNVFLENVIKTIKGSHPSLELKNLPEDHLHKRLLKEIREALYAKFEEGLKMKSHSHE